MPTTEMTTIGQHLRQARKQKGLSQEQVAERLNVRRATISDIERGVYKGVLPPLLNYLGLLGMTLELKKAPSEFPQLSDLDRLFNEDDA